MADMHASVQNVIVPWQHDYMSERLSPDIVRGAISKPRSDSRGTYLALLTVSFASPPSPGNMQVLRHTVRMPHYHLGHITHH
jgi:hypothetical protein